MTKDEFIEKKNNFLEQQLKESEKLFENNSCNEKAINIALRKAYSDSQPRLISGHKNMVRVLWEDDEDKPMGYLKRQIKNFLENEFDKEKFDEWYKTTYENFLDKYKGIMRQNKIDENVVENQGIGKVQKIINMTLKYLYCMADENQEKKFEHCHMPLDHYTLENWFCRVVGQNMIYEEGIDKKQLDELKVWSKILDYGLYMKVQKKISAYVKESKYEIEGIKMSSLQAEFIIWEEEKLRKILLGVANLELGEKKKYNNAELEVIVNEAARKINLLKKK